MGHLLPTWFVFDGEAVQSNVTPRIGSDGPKILAEYCGYSKEKIDELIKMGVVGQTEFVPYKK